MRPPEMRSPATLARGRAEVSQTFSTAESDTAATELQAQQLRARFSLRLLPSLLAGPAHMGVAAMNAQEIGIALKGRRNGTGWLVSCPCPNHGKGRGDRSPSLSVSDGDDGKLLLRCFAGCDFLDVLDELKHRELIEGKQTGALPQFTPSLRRVGEPAPDFGALTTWRAAINTHKTPVDEYLTRRGIYLRPRMLRCRLDGRSMVAGVQAPDGNVIAIQQTWLTSEGQKATAKRLTTGRLGSGGSRS